MKKAVLTTLQIVVTVGVLFLVFRDPHKRGEMARALGNADQLWLLAGFAIYGVVLIALAFAPTFETAVALFALGGIVNVLFYVPNVTISQELTPPDLRARVFGARIALLNLTWLPIVILSGALADAVGVALLIAVAGLTTLVAAIVGAFIPIVRDVG